MLEEYSNERPASDGEIYRKLRQYESEHNARFRKRWWSRLSENKEKRLKALLDHDDFRDAFDKLLVVPGLWAGLRIGSLGKLTAIKCDEVCNVFPIGWLCLTLSGNPKLPKLYFRILVFPGGWEFGRAYENRPANG